jgi:hypothetical protein
MDHVTNEPPRRAGGDKHTPQAKVDIARREQQIVALRLRGISFHEIGRVIGISRISAYRAFHKALRRNTDQDIQTHHRSELAELEAEQANVWRAMDANKDDWRSQMSGTAQLRGIQVRRAKLLGLDAPTKLGRARPISHWHRRDLGRTAGAPGRPRGTAHRGTAPHL